jgi:hypothetical protein
MSNPDLDEFIKNVRKYQSSEYALDDSYQRILERRDIWEKLSELDNERTRAVIEFLNVWKCRLSYDCAPNLARALKGCSTLISELGRLSLEEVTTEELLANLDAIQELSKTISSVRAGRRTVGATGASKILHLTNPSFFMMTDNRIRDGWGCSDNEVGYGNFMWRMELFGNAIIHSYSTSRDIPTKDAFIRLRSECKSSAATLPKLLGEYNWTKSNS